MHACRHIFKQNYTLIYLVIYLQCILCYHICTNFASLSLSLFVSPLAAGSCRAAGYTTCCVGDFCEGVPPFCFCDISCAEFEDCCDLTLTKFALLMVRKLITPHPYEMSTSLVDSLDIFSCPFGFTTTLYWWLSRAMEMAELAPPPLPKQTTSHDL